MEKITDIVFDKIVDQILDLACGKTKTEIENLMNQNRNQKILEHCMKKIADSDWFKNEFPNVEFCLDHNIIYSIDDKKIRIGLEKRKITENITEVVRHCFISDNDDITRISEMVTEQYIQQAKTTMQLYEIIEHQQRNYENLDGAIKDVKQIIISNKRKEEKLLLEKEQLLKQELSNEVKNYIFDMMNRYLYFIYKCSPEMENPSRCAEFDVVQLMQVKIKEVIDSINSYVNNDFCEKGVRVFSANGLRHVEEDVDYFKFMEFGFKNAILEDTRKILDYRDIIDTETYVYLLRVRNALNGPLFPSLYEMGQYNIINCKKISIDVDCFRKELYSLGENILRLSKKFQE